MLAAPQPILNARGADQIKTKITFCSWCVEGTKKWSSFWLNTGWYLLLIVYITTARKDVVHHSMLQCFLIYCLSQGAHCHSQSTLADFTLYLNKFLWSSGDKHFLFLCSHSHSVHVQLKPAPHQSQSNVLSRTGKSQFSERKTHVMVHHLFFQLLLLLLQNFADLA